MISNSPDLMLFVEWSEPTAAALSCGVNLLLIWLILFRTPENLREYSRALLCNCCVDIIFTVISVLVQPVRLRG